ncbi:MAG: T9SS type A sorting domain-containing protein [Bacteroidales bacterium]|nr:T9SS type A sorting domain-containing protein [Bacteroidales bacterium]
MKKLLISLFIFCALNANAQNYFMTFAGTGSATTVNTIKVENLTSGASLSLNGGDILHLTGTVGISTIESTQSSDIKIYPNPMTENSLIEFYPPVSGNAIISVFEMTGKLVAQIQNYLENSRQVFLLSGFKSGYYLINIRGKGYQLSGKLLSKSSTNLNLSISRISSDQAVDYKKLNNEAKGSQATVDMLYTTGDRLKFTGISGNFSTVKTDIPAQDKTITFNFMPCADNDNNNYPVVMIGTMIWMAENLKTTTYNNGDLIGSTTPATLDISSETTPKYQWAFNGEENNVAVYGRLYTWYAITDSRNICPTGWYVPNDGDWKLLTTFLGGESVAGGKLKETGTTHWTTPNTKATNETGFTALPGGWHRWDGTFNDLGKISYWQSMSEYNSSNGWTRAMYYNYSDASRTYSGKKGGFPVRCLKATAPMVITSPVTSITTSSAVIGGITSYGGSAVTDRGVYFGRYQNPVTNGIKLTQGTGEGSFSGSILGLIPNTTYYVRAYAINSLGTSYGEELSFKTNPLTIPVLNTTTVYSITQVKAISGGSISYDGGTAVTARGVCWSISENPTIADNHTSDGTGTGSFTSNIQGLSHSTKYYVRAYAVNNIGTAYGAQVSFTTQFGGPIVFNPSLTYGTVTDIEGNVYTTIQIGTQLWMAENLRTTKYKDNTLIPRITDNTAWKDLLTPGYCWYDNDSLAYKSTYGALYNWYAVSTKKLCPTGWHVPTEGDFETFGLYVGDVAVAGGKMKETGLTHWITPNTGATNEIGFTALPGGYRRYTDGVFTSIAYYGEYWSSAEYSTEGAGGAELSYNSNGVSVEGEPNKKYGFSVRCIKD